MFAIPFFDTFDIFSSFRIRSYSLLKETFDSLFLQVAMRQNKLWNSTEMIQRKKKEKPILLLNAISKRLIQNEQMQYHFALSLSKKIKL